MTGGAWWLASGLGVGSVPRAPGTAGSALGLLLGLILLAWFGWFGLLFGVMLVSAAGLWAIPRTGADADDPGWVVIDEVAGQMIALLGLGSGGWFAVIMAFGLFRLFDIWKPGPVGWADARHDALGIMADDWIAGLLAGFSLLVLQWVF
ncbi:MAG: phosphatidylglycerophosphatase A family protein [Acidiphilium sp.]